MIASGSRGQLLQLSVATRAFIGATNPRQLQSTLSASSIWSSSTSSSYPSSSSSNILSSSRRHAINGGSTRGFHSTFPNRLAQSDEKRTAFGGKEPEFNVGFEDDMEMPPDRIKVPFLSETVKQKIYKAFKDDPETNNVKALAQKYGASLDRIKAVLFLLSNREKAMKEQGLVDEKGDAGVPKQWSAIYDKYITLTTAPEAPVATATDKNGDSTTKTAESDSKDGKTAEAPKGEAKEESAAAAAAAADGAGGAGVVGKHTPSQAIDAIAKEHALSVGEVKNIVDKMILHTYNQENLETHENTVAEILEKWADAGVNTNFRETTLNTGGKSLERSYYPELFGDEDKGEVLAKLLKRIEKETRAKLDLNVDSYISEFGSPLSDKDKAALPHLKNPGTTTTSTIMTNKNQSKVLSRWKWAFRDTSLGHKARTPTWIVTRSGKWRLATPLEEIKRSWWQAPNYLELQIAKDKLAKYSDPDGDESLAKKMSQEKLKKRKEMKASMTPAK